MTPKTSSRWMSGAASTEWMADSRTKASRSGVCSKRWSSRYSPVRAVVRVRIARPETPTSGSTWTLSSRSRLASVRAWTAGSIQASAMPCPPMRSIVTPLAWRRRADASMTDWRISPWSRIALTRPAISRSVRSASAVWASWARDRPSSSISRAFVMAIAAWLASAPTRPASVGVNAPSRFE